ncbi:hypothetical protein EVAR_31761_1 [Eumeta japonica]|uniref:Uncharacterized protein n=1 Tax=Eumeta variegata TaxID=151549 RepID=A0A4C1W2X5_EUMVA|nr:hypothetical protein EVAR_31761_1 [Eumeta japonica]
MELEGGHRNSVIKRRNSIEFGLVFNDAKETLRLSNKGDKILITAVYSHFAEFLSRRDGSSCSQAVVHNRPPPAQLQQKDIVR